MLGESYVQIDGRYEPINAIASGLIKCTSCNQMLPESIIGQHLNSHILPKYLIPETNSNGIKKLTFADLIDTQVSQQSDQIQIISMKPQQLPSSEKQRRNILPPLIETPITLKNALPNDTWKSNIDNSLLSRIDFGGIRQQQVQFLPLETQMQLPTNIQAVNKKSIALYQNQNKQVTIMEGQLKPRKYSIRHKLNTECPYKMIQTTNSQESQLGRSVRRVASTESINLNIIKIPRNMIDTNTKTNNLNPINTQLRDIPAGLTTPSKSRRYMDDHTRPTNFHTQGFNRYNCDCKCPCCGGFYCSVCKSDIPPQYRPVPNHRQQTQLRQQQISQYYQRIHQIRNNNHCQRCNHQ